jgi:hypothetical protein
MSFVEGFGLMVLFGALSHSLYKKRRQQHKAWLAWYSIIAVTAVLLLDIAIYVGWMDWMIGGLNTLPWLVDNPISSGKEWMWNPFRYLGLDLGVEPQPGLDWFAVIFFMCYLPVFNFFKEGSRQAVGFRTYQQGMLWSISKNW